jgi:pyruvate formate lyase activating enzyme
MEKECSLYKKQGDSLRCTACAHRCIISKGKTGICGVRKNIDGKLYLLVYGKVIAKHVDPIEKKPLYHFLPGTQAFSVGTIGCNFRCGFCQNFDISQLKDVVGREISPSQIVKEAIQNKCKSIAYTYNEPTIFIEFVKDIAVLAKKKGLKNILVSNGYETKECIDFIAPFIDAMNLDLKSFSDKFYMKQCKAKLDPVLETIKYAHKKGIWIEITTLLIPNENDSKKEIENIAKFIAGIDKNIPWHISRFFPMFQMTKKEPTEIKKIKQAYEIGKKYLNHVYIGNVPEESPTLCPSCKKEVIFRSGFFIKNQIKDSKCPFCKTKIKGVFE